MRNVSGLEAVYRDYRAKKVEFFFIYKALAHPERDGIVQPILQDERLVQAREASKRLGNTIPFLVDAMDNRLKHALGDRNNSEFIVDPEGTIVRKRTWSNPELVRKDLEELVGKVEKMTRPEDLSLRLESPPKDRAPKGLVARLPRTGMAALVSEPQLEKDGAPFYAKLRAEGDTNLLDVGKGKLYLGFHLDPFLGAHWNNLKRPLRLEIDCPEEVKLSPTRAEAVNPKAETDIDPREFLLDIGEWPAEKAIRVTVTYAACTDDVCRELRQSYTVHRQGDRDGGRAMSGMRTRSPEELVKRLMEGDKNRDGMLTKDEVGAQYQSRFAEFDLNKDGKLDRDEIQKMAERLVERKKP